jgi:hypothetical protein
MGDVVLTLLDAPISLPTPKRKEKKNPLEAYFGVLENFLIVKYLF